MAEVHIVDIDGEQWNIKDSPLTEKVADITTPVILYEGQRVTQITLPNAVDECRFLVVSILAGSATKRYIIPIIKNSEDFIANIIGWEGDGLVSKDNCLFYTSCALYRYTKSTRILSRITEVHNNINFIQGITEVYGYR